MRHLWPIQDQIEAQTAKPSTNPLSAYRENPQKYAREVLKLELTPDQEAMLGSILSNRRTIVKASHAVGKTFTAAVAASWWYDCWQEHISYITAPTWPQALGLTFKQLKTLRRARKLSGIILDTGIVRDENKDREGAHYVRALNAERGEGFQGEHSAPILIVIEEGVGVPKYIWDAAGGLMTHPDCRMFVIGNPTEESNEFGLAAESVLFNTMSISALNHPNITAELVCSPPPFPGAVRLQWLYEMLEKECDQISELTEDAFEFVAIAEIKKALSDQPADLSVKSIYMPTAYFQGRVLGEFPTQADQQVIPKSWLKFQRTIEISGIPELGCDVARFGDDRTTKIARIDGAVLWAKELRKFDNEAIIVSLREDAKELGSKFNADPKKVPIKIDVTGGLGTGPYDRLISEGYNVSAINSSNKAFNEEQYPNRRSELWFDTRDRAKDKRLDLSRLPRDVRQRLEKELSCAKYVIRSGRKVVEDKADIKKRLGYSPDLADGLNLAFALPSKGIFKQTPGRPF
jgi:hypothetical protein